jgi:hypothetical protein
LNVEAGTEGAAGAAGASGAFAGLLHVSVHKIEGFGDNAGFMDRTGTKVQIRTHALALLVQKYKNTDNMLLASRNAQTCLYSAAMRALAAHMLYLLY